MARRMAGPCLMASTSRFTRSESFQPPSGREITSLFVGFDSATVFEPETLQFLSVLAGQVSACVAHAILAHNRSTFQALADSAPMAIFINRAFISFLRSDRSVIRVSVSIGIR